MRRRSLVPPLVIVLVSAVGCELEPKHLPALYSQRDYFQKLIDDVEKQYNVPPKSDPWEAVAEQWKEDLAAERKKIEVERKKGEMLEAENRRLLQENKLLADAISSVDDPWFKSLNTEQQIQWRIHRDLIRAGGKTEIRQNVQQTFPGGSP